MIHPSRTSAQVLHHGRRIATELAGAALDPEARLTMADRLALAALSLAVDAEASRRAGVDPIAGTCDALADGLALIERTSAAEPAIRRASG